MCLRKHNPTDIVFENFKQTRNVGDNNSLIDLIENFNFIAV